MKKFKTILLIDDDETNNFITELLFEEMNLVEELIQARNGKEGFEKLKELIKEENIPELILLDLKMPVMDGFGFMELFQQLEFNNKETIKIIILTTSSDPIDLGRAKDSGVTGYLKKPLTDYKIEAMQKKYL